MKQESPSVRAERIQLEVCGLTEVLEAHGVDWTPELVTELWHCVEAGRESGAGKGL